MHLNLASKFAFCFRESSQSGLGAVKVRFGLERSLWWLLSFYPAHLQMDESREKQQRQQLRARLVAVELCRRCCFGHCCCYWRHCCCLWQAHKVTEPGSIRVAEGASCCFVCEPNGSGKTTEAHKWRDLPASFLCRL